MLGAMLMIAGIAVSDTASLETKDTESVVSKEEIAKLEEEQWRTSKYLLLGTIAAIPPGIAAVVTGLITAVSAGLSVYFFVRIAEAEYSGTTASHEHDVNAWTAWAFTLGGVASSCGIVACTSGVISAASFASGVKAFVEDPGAEPDPKK